MQPSIQSKLQQAAESLQTGLDHHRHRLCRTIQHVAELAAMVDQESGLRGQRKRVNRALVRGLQRLTTVAHGGRWHYQHGSSGPLFASMSVPFLRRRPQGELMPIEKLRELFDELDQHDHGRLSIADFRVGHAMDAQACHDLTMAIVKLDLLFCGQMPQGRQADNDQALSIPPTLMSRASMIMVACPSLTSG